MDVDKCLVAMEDHKYLFAVKHRSPTIGKQSKLISCELNLVLERIINVDPYSFHSSQCKIGKSFFSEI